MNRGTVHTRGVRCREGLLQAERKVWRAEEDMEGLAVMKPVVETSCP